MAYEKQTIKNRNIEFPSRYKLYNSTTSKLVVEADLIQVTGTVLEQGTKVDADLLQRYENALADGNITIGSEQPEEGWWYHEIATNKIRLKPPGYSRTLHPETNADVTLYSGLITGATNTKVALDKIVEIRTITIGTTWSGAAPPYTQTIAVAGITSNDRPIISPVYSTTLSTAIAQKEAWNMVSKIHTNAGTITVTCFEEKPTVTIPIQIKGV